MKQTAVEWLISKLASKIDDEYWFNQQDITELVHQAIQMEKQQIIHAYGQGTADEAGEIIDATKSAEQYYNETYGKEG